MAPVANCRLSMLIIVRYRTIKGCIVTLGQMAKDAAVLLDGANLEINRSPDELIAQTPHWKVRKGTYCGTPACVMSLRTTPSKDTLSASVRSALDGLAQLRHPVCVMICSIGWSMVIV